MSACAIKRGFFVLRDCGQAAAVTCSMCSRPTCPEHTVRRGLPGQPHQPVICVECSAKNEQAGPDGEASPYRRRHRFYTSGCYNPIYDGDQAPGAYYDDYDFRGFDSQTPGNGDGDVQSGDSGDEGGGDAGFADS